jgi:hypothetical protein
MRAGHGSCSRRRPRNRPLVLIEWEEQPGRAYEFDVPKPGGGTETKTIRDDTEGHVYPDDPTQNRGPHFNDEAGNHYDYCP